MEHQIWVRRLTEEDTSRDCRDPCTDEDEYTLHLNALVNDISTTEGVSSAVLDGGAIAVRTSMDTAALKKSLKRLFCREFCYVRFLTIECRT